MPVGCFCASHVFGWGPALHSNVKKGLRRPRSLAFPVCQVAPEMPPLPQTTLAAPTRSGEEPLAPPRASWPPRCASLGRSPPPGSRSLCRTRAAPKAAAGTLVPRRRFPRRPGRDCGRTRPRREGPCRAVSGPWLRAGGSSPLGPARAAGSPFLAARRPGKPRASAAGRALRGAAFPGMWGRGPRSAGRRPRYGLGSGPCPQDCSGPASLRSSRRASRFRSDRFRDLLVRH